MSAIRVFFGWSPLQLITATAALRATASNETAIFIWLGRQSGLSGFRELIERDWDLSLELNSYALLDFNTYRARYVEIDRYIREDLGQRFSLADVREIAVPSDDEYFSLMFANSVTTLQERSRWSLTSLYEDGLGLYICTRQRNVKRHLAKLLMDRLAGRATVAPTIGLFAGNSNISTIYALFPEKLPSVTRRRTVDLRHTFKDLIEEWAASSSRNVQPLPPESALLLSENISPAHLSNVEEQTLFREIVTNLRGRSDRVFVKPHHFDMQWKRDFLQACGAELIDLPDVPYELLHDSLRPRLLAAIWSSALLYCNVLNTNTQTLAFCSRHFKTQHVAPFFDRAGITLA